jgi:hypothetical protein
LLRRKKKNLRETVGEFVGILKRSSAWGIEGIVAKIGDCFPDLRR